MPFVKIDPEKASLDSGPQENIDVVHGGFKASRLMVVLMASLPTVLSLGSMDAAGGSRPLQIGIAKSFFKERPEGFMDIARDEFKEGMKDITGLEGELIPKYDAFEVAEKLYNKQLEFGIFHGHEYAWVLKKNPDLRPLIIGVNKDHEERAYLIVHQNSPAKTMADLRGKKLDLPVGTKEHCRLFLVRSCSDSAQQEPGAFFASIKKSASQEAALDDVCRDKVQATIIDTIGLEFYKELKGPVFAKNLRVLQVSEAFPQSVIVYKPGVPSADTVTKFYDGLLKAHTSAQGRDMMKTWKINAFEPIPKDYTERLTEVLKRYPVPSPPR